MDPELKAIKAIIDALEPLDKATRARVLRWVSDRYEVGFEPVIDMPTRTRRRAGRPDRGSYGTKDD